LKISYKKLWHLLLDRNLNKRTLHQKTGLSSSTIAKLSKGLNVNTDVIVKICETLNCGINDIMDVVPDDSPEENPQEVGDA
jgi:DNA-binding Xre family transcriptional regulator